MMDNNEKMRIHLSIADSIYSMTINRKDEELYRKAAKEINDKLNMYRERRPEGAMLDHLRMVAFDFAFKVVNSEYRNDTQPYKDKLEQLTKEMEELFQKEEQKEGI